VRYCVGVLPLARAKLVATLAATDHYSRGDATRHARRCPGVIRQTPTAEYRAKFGWRQLAALLRRAAQGREDAAEVGAALQLILQIECVPYRVV
jgi:hypothetical protein